MSRPRIPRPRRRRAAPPARRSHSWLQPTKSRPPEPFFDSGQSLAKVCPETALMCAVLEDAFECFYSAKDPMLAAEAKRWFFSDPAPAPFSFVSLCEALGLDAKDIRRRLSHGLPIRLDGAVKIKQGVPPRTAKAPASLSRRPFAAGRPAPPAGK